MKETTNTTTTGAEMSIISVKEIVELVKAFDRDEPVLHHIYHHCDIERSQLIKKLAAVEGNADMPELVKYYGVPIIEKKTMPLNEIWLQDKDGKIIQKFRV
jgi:hypothetical protein